jgi:isoquinoline 1-oxidoreductase beta subunit
METQNKQYSRRSFLKVSSISGGGMMIGASWFMSLKPIEVLGGENAAPEWVMVNGYIQITADNKIKIQCPNPEFGQNVMTSMPMIVAEELGANWKDVTVEMAKYDTPTFRRQFTGGSQSIRAGWNTLRNAGATARMMLIAAAAQEWNVPVGEITAAGGQVTHKATGRQSSYGALAAVAAKLTVPAKPELKAKTDFSIIGKATKNTVGAQIVSGKPLFTMDYKVPGMLIAMAERPPAFGMKLKSFDAVEALKMPGIKDVFSIKVYNDDFARAMFDARTFNELVIIVGKSTWEVMNARKVLRAQWEPITESKEIVAGFGGNKREETIPAGLESSTGHLEAMTAAAKNARVLRKDGNPEAAFASAHTILERTYSAPFLAHNTMEPISCFAQVTADKAFFVAPTQAPDFIAPTIAARLGIPAAKIDIQLARMGGGFGRRAYCHYIVEAGIISQRMNAPVKLVYSREDDMTNGIYRPAYRVTYRAALDAANNITAFHVKGGGVPEGAVHANRFPAGAFDNYLAEGWSVPSNITIGAFRAPGSNFIAAAEQSFLDELAEKTGNDPIEFRLGLMKKAKEQPVGKNNDYDAARYMAVLELVRDKSGWKGKSDKRGVAAYFCHNSYAAHVLDVTMKGGMPFVEKVVSALDCGVVVNPEGAKNMVEGAVVDGIGNCLFGEMTFENGEPQKKNFNQYRMIRHREAPKNIDVHFVQNGIDPTGLGEPPFPPVFAALANALYRATGKRFYDQPFIKQLTAEG